jgi:hypothetical protein
MPAERWNQHLVDRITALETELRRLRRRLTRQKHRAELWKQRATKGPTKR